MTVRDWMAENTSLLISIGAMLLLIVGTVVKQGTLLQKTLFLIGAPTLGVTAYMTGQKMLTILQGVVSLSAILAFIPGIPVTVRFVILLGPALLGVIYLYRIRYHENDRFWPIGGFGLLLLGAGLSVAGVAPFLFNLLLATGAAIVALYAGLGYFVEGIRIQAIWIVLNIIFMINPLLRVITSL